MGKWGSKLCMVLGLKCVPQYTHVKTLSPRATVPIDRPLGGD